LRDEDALALTENAFARVVFPTDIYELGTAGDYLIRAPGSVVSNSDSREGCPILSMRGRSEPDNPLLAIAKDDLVLPPGDLFAYVKPPVIRASQGVKVLSPRGQIYSRTPTLEWESTPGVAYQASLTVVGQENTSKQRFPWVACPTSTLAWADTDWPPLNRGDVCFLKLRENGRIVTGEEASFFVLPKNDAASLESALAALHQVVEPGSARSFVQANLFLRSDWDCAAEARTLAQSLVDSEPTNHTYLKLLQRCYARLGLPEEVRTIGRMVDPEPDHAAVDAVVGERSRVAVLYFKNNSPDNRALDALSKGLCSMMIADLKAATDYTLVERDRIQEVLAELNLTRGAEFDQKTVAKVGKLVGAEYLVFGSYFELLNKFVMNARVVRVETGIIVGASGVNGKTEDFDILEQELSRQLLAKISLAEGRDAIPEQGAMARGAQFEKRAPLSAVVDYGEALDKYDRGDARGARTILMDIVETNPGFAAAKATLAHLTAEQR